MCAGAGVMGAVMQLLCLPFSRTLPATDSPGLCWEVAFQFLQQIVNRAKKEATLMSIKAKNQT